MTCEDCGAAGASACPLCEKAVCQPCAEGEGEFCDCVLLQGQELNKARKRRLAARRLLQEDDKR